MKIEMKSEKIAWEKNFFYAMLIEKKGMRNELLLALLFS